MRKKLIRYYGIKEVRKTPHPLRNKGNQRGTSCVTLFASAKPLAAGKEFQHEFTSVRNSGAGLYPAEEQRHKSSFAFVARDAIKETPTRKSKISTLPSREGISHAPKAVTNGSHLTVNCSQESTHPNLPSQGKEKHAPQALTDLTSYRLNDLTTFKKVAFTLAEILITLAIIGIVAALTIPTLVNNYKKKQYVAGLQKGYAQIQQVLKLAMANNGVDLLENTSLIQSINGENIYGYFDDQSAFVTELGKYLKITKACMPMEYDNGCHNIGYIELGEKTSDYTLDDYYSVPGSNRGLDLQIFTADGMIYYFNNLRKHAYFNSDEVCNEIKADGGSMCSNIGRILVDINGSKGPNITGRDLFMFDVDAYGTVFLYGSTAAFKKSSNWKTAGTCQSSDTYGGGCAGRIFEQGWKMDY